MIKKLFFKEAVIGLFVFTAVACGNGRNTAGNEDTAVTSDTLTAESDTLKSAQAEIAATKSDTTGSGQAIFSKKDDGDVELNLRVSFPKMANKIVAVHIHEHGDCSDAGKSAHGHWNPTKEDHGKWGSGAFHSGDIGNVTLNEKGEGSISLSSDRWTIGGDEKTNILNRAVIVHSGVDDYTSQPTGNAGSRIGCGLIARK